MVSVRRVFSGSFGVLGALLCVTPFVLLPVHLQMIAYSVAVLYIGCHQSLFMLEVRGIAPVSQMTLRRFLFRRFLDASAREGRASSSRRGAPAGLGPAAADVAGRRGLP